MKKSFIKLITFIILVTFCCLFTTAFNTKSDVVQASQQYVEVAKKLITDFYKNKDLGMENDLAQYIGNKSLLNYLTDKYKTHQHVSELNSIKKINYTIDLKLVEEKTNESKCYLKFAVAVRFNYADLPNVDSGFGEGAELLLKEVNGKYLVMDFYDRCNYYDSAVRGEDCDVVKALDSDQDLEKINELRSDKIKEKQLQLKNRIDKSYEEQLKQPTQLQTNYSTLASLSPLNRPNIVTYARSNCFMASPSSGNGVVNYYDFSQIPNNYDCTNFVSHALLAGGATVYDTGGPGISPTGWYFRDSGNRSSSWSGVINLHGFITTNTTKGPAGSSFIYYIFDERNGQPYSLEDILQFYDTSYGNWRHSTIVTEFYLYSGSYYYGALVTGRSGYIGGFLQYNSNQKAEDIHPGEQKRVIKLSGNYQ